MVIRSNNIVNIENAVIFWRNFSGKESKFNRAGDRNFEVYIDDPEVAEQMKEDGWNIKIQQPKGEGDAPRYHLPVCVSYRYYEPEIYKGTDKHRMVKLDEASVKSLDQDDIVSTDIVIRGSHWEMNGKEGIKAYLRAMYVIIEENMFASEYAEQESPSEAPIFVEPDDELPFK